MALSPDLAGQDHTHEREQNLMTYYEVSESSDLYKRAVTHYENLKSLHFQNTPEFLCLGKTVIFQIIDPNGNISITDNRVTQPISYCEKHVKDIDHYAPCAEVCGQLCHSEITGFLEFMMKNGQLTLQDVVALANETIILNRTDSAGVPYIGKRISHAELKKLIIRKNLKFPEGTTAYMYGHDKCCPQCAEILEMTGLTKVGVTPSTMPYQRIERATYHDSEFAQSHIQEGNPYFNQIES